MSACRSCHAPVVWVRTAAGKRMPLDPDPVAGGNVVVNGDVATVLPPGTPMPVGVHRYQSHFATCPQASTHRRKQ